MAVSALAGGLTAWSVARINRNDKEIQVVERTVERNPSLGTQFTAYEADRYPDLTYAAENAVKAVVNIEAIQEVEMRQRSYDPFLEFFGIPQHIVPLRQDFTLDLDAMRAVPCRGYYIANPNAPTGVGICRSEMEAFVASVPEKVVVLDEAYMDFFGESCAPLTKRYANVLVVKTFSKSYSLAGIRCGYAVGDAALIEGLTRMKDCFNSYPVDSVAEAVCAAAVADTQYYARVTEQVIAERGRLQTALRERGFTVPESRANFLFAGRGRADGRTLYEGLKARGVLVRFWDKPVLRDFVRITVGSYEENTVLLKELDDILK